MGLQEKTELETENLLLKHPNMDFVDPYVDFLDKNKEFFIPWEPDRADHFYTQKNQKLLMEKSCANFSDERDYKFFISAKNDPDTIIGDFEFINIMKGPFRSCFLAYKIGQDYLRKGFMSEALKMGVKFLFEEKKMHRIEANVVPWNIASSALVEKLGFKSEGKSEKYLRVNGKWEDHVRFALLNPEVE